MAGQLEQHPLDQLDWQLYQPPPRTNDSYVQLLSPRRPFSLKHPRRSTRHESGDIRLGYFAQVMSQLVSSKDIRAVTSLGDRAPSSTNAPSAAQKKETLMGELRASLSEGEALQTRLTILEAAEKATSLIRDASIAVGTGVATVISGPGGGAAFRTGIGSISHLAEHGVGEAINAPNTQSLATQLRSDIVEGAVSYVGGTVAMKAAGAAASALGTKAIATTTSKLVTAEAAGFANATVQNAHTVGSKILNGEEFSRHDAKAIAANYVAAGLSAGISSKVPVTPRLSTVNAAEAIAHTGIAAGQQYSIEGSISPNAVLVAAAQNIASAAAVAKRATRETPAMKEAPSSDHVSPRTSSLIVHGIPGDEISGALTRHVDSWREHSHEWSPLQRWTFEESERRGLQIEVVKNKGSASPGKVEVSLDETYDNLARAFESARRGMYNSLAERALGKAPDLSSPAGVYLHRLCEELAVTLSHLERAELKMLQLHGALLTDMGLFNLYVRTSGDLRTMVNELRCIHPEQAEFYKECLQRAGIDVELEGANHGVKIPVYGLADASVLDPLRRSLAEWRSTATDTTPLTKWIMETAEKHRIEVTVIKHRIHQRGSHAYNGTRVVVALADVQPSHGTVEIARHELWHAASCREFFDKVDPKRLYRKEPSSLYLDELVAHLAAGRTLQEAHTHVMHNYEPSFTTMKWPETYARLNGDLTRILDQVGQKVSPEHREFYRNALSMAGVKVE